MSVEIELVSDGEGLAVIGSSAMVDAFLHEHDLAASAKALPDGAAITHVAAAALQAGSVVAANSGRWVKLTRESAAMVKRSGLRSNASTGVSTGVLKGTKGQIGGFVEFAKAPASLLTNPAALSSIGGLMAQMAMQQQLDEISDYLAVIDRKVDDVLRAHKNAVMADMDGVAAVVDEALRIREKTGRVSEVTWSKVQTNALVIARAESYALRQLRDIATKVQTGIDKGVGDVASDLAASESEVKDWLVVLAECSRLQDASGILELDRVAEVDPGDLEPHRQALLEAHRARRDRVLQTTGELLSQLASARGLAREKVLFQPRASKRVALSAVQVAEDLDGLRSAFGTELRDDVDVEVLWGAAVGNVVNGAARMGVSGVSKARGLGIEAANTGRSIGAATVRRLRRREQGSNSARDSHDGPAPEGKERLGERRRADRDGAREAAGPGNNSDEPMTPGTL